MDKQIDVKLAFNKYDCLEIIIDELDEDIKDYLTTLFANVRFPMKKLWKKRIRTSNPEVKQFIDELTSKIVKNTESEKYGLNFRVARPVRFLFNEDGSFKGIDVNVRRASEWERLLIEELKLKLSKALSQ